MKHLPIGGSTAERTLKCPAWLERASRVPKPPSSNAANDGNLKHDAMEAYYMGDQGFLDMVGELTFADLTLTEDHLPPLYLARDMVDGVFDKYDVDEYLCEPFVEFSKDYIGGSVDIVWLSADRKTLGILDYKFGRKKVGAERNSQLLFYAMCVAEDPKTRKLVSEVENVVLTIVQPECSKEADTWEGKLSDVFEFQDALIAALAGAEYAETGSHCFFCPAQMTCPEKKAQAASALILDPKQAATVSGNLDLADELEAWIKSLREHALNAAMLGAAIPEYKLVEKKTQRRLKDTAETVLKRFGREVYDTKLKGIGALEKIIGKKEFAALDVVEKPEGKPELAPVSDKRPALPPVDGAKNLKDFVAKKSG